MYTVLCTLLTTTAGISFYDTCKRHYADFTQTIPGTNNVIVEGGNAYSLVYITPEINFKPQLG